MSDDLKNVVEFYDSGTTKPFLRLRELFNVPRQGDEIDIAGRRGTVKAVNWNLDYPSKPHEEWRCNIYIEREIEPDA